ncbi:uncharacterized protein [Venturia canescens]|uniref:uncharacterized protein n=1 Tax=Venturia canescens TaxID=32260 RepID=UPI001C9CA271|nr:uncharacterized protein LOC122410617 [Venturia canescens]
MLNDDDELPDDEEEILVYVEFDGSVASNTLSNEKLQFDMIGLDKEHPIMQVNGKFYEGTYRNAVGTYMFFESDKHPHVDDPVFDVTPSLKYLAKTRKVLRMNRIFVEPKTELLGDSKDPECLPTMEAVKKAGVPPRYQEETLESWRRIREDRMKALNDYLEKQRVREEKKSQGIEPDSASDDDNPFAVYKPPTKHKKNKHLENRESSKAEEHRKTPSIEKIHNEPAQSNEKTAKDCFQVSVGASPPGISCSMMDDPGPSTSKNSKPWTSPSSDKHGETFSNSDSEDVNRMNIPNIKSLHRATVQVGTRMKIRKYGKVGKKKLKKTDSSGAVKTKEVRSKTKGKKDFHKNDTDTRPNEVSEMDENEKKKDEEPVKTLESMASLSINNSTEQSEKNVDCEVLECPEKTESLIDQKKLEKQRKRDEKMLLLANKLKQAAEEQRLKNQSSEGTP